MSDSTEQNERTDTDADDKRHFVESLRLPMAEIILCVEELEARARDGVERELYLVYSRLADAARRAQALVDEATPKDIDPGDEPTAMFAPFKDS